jgi:putative ABC transport system permease protein
MRGADFLREIRQAFARDRLRVALTVGGIAVGSFAVAMLVSLGAAVKAAIGGALKSLGEDLVIVMPEQARGGPLGGHAAAAAMLTEADLACLRRLDSVRAASAVVLARAVVTAQAESVATTIVGADAAYFDVAKIALADGEPFGEDADTAARPVAIVGATVRRRLLADGDALGRSLGIVGRQVRVIGVARERGRGVGGVDEDDFVLVPKRFARTQVAARDTATAVDAIFLLSPEGGALADTIADAYDALARSRRQADIRDAISVDSLQGLMSTSLQASDLLTALLAGMAAISVFVGGVGIVNVMLADLADRRLEIGLKLALGAPPRTIALEFLAEAVLLAFAGAAAGLLLAATLAAAVNATHWLEVGLTPLAALLAVGLALGVGIAAGVYPAGRAARLDPREILRDA